MVAGHVGKLAEGRNILSRALEADLGKLADSRASVDGLVASQVEKIAEGRAILTKALESDIIGIKGVIENHSAKLAEDRTELSRALESDLSGIRNLIEGHSTRLADDRTLLTLALVENLQRDDLSPVETARSYQRLIDEFQASPADVGELVGKDRSTVANALRLLRLPGDVREMLEDGRLSEGHARALLGVNDTVQMSRLAKDAAANGWTVRDTESRVREGRAPRTPRRPTGPQEASAEHRRVEDALRKHLGTDIRVTARRKGRGLIALSYYSNDDLARLLELLLGRPFEG